jgi:hypothetical protein
MSQGLIFAPKMQEGKVCLDIDDFVDADSAGLYGKEWMEDPSCAKSWTSFIISVAGFPMIWSSKLQPDIALRTMHGLLPPLFNMNNKSLGRQRIQWAEKMNLIELEATTQIMQRPQIRYLQYG